MDVPITNVHFAAHIWENALPLRKNPIIFEDIDYAAKYFKRQNRVFICDGDALIIPQKRLVPILERIKERIPWVKELDFMKHKKHKNEN